jgi:hypothetical protein
VPYEPAGRPHIVSPAHVASRSSRFAVFLTLAADLATIPVWAATNQASPLSIVELVGLLLFGAVALIVFFGCATSQRAANRVVASVMILGYAAGWGALGNALGHSLAQPQPVPSGAAVVVGVVGLVVHWRLAQGTAALASTMRAAGKL